MNKNIKKIKNNKKLLLELKEKSVGSSKEICGYLKNEIFYERKNSHPYPEKYFLIDPSSCMWGEDVVLFHSHPDKNELIGFSDWDMENQKFFCLDMVLYSVNNDEFYYMSYG